MKVFVSWSKPTSRKVALELKKFLEEFFASKTLEVFVSASAIEPGEAWFNTIKERITDSKMCIIVMTDENEKSRWTHFEAGAIAYNTLSANIVPFLITSRALDERSPLRHYQYITNRSEDVLRLVKIVKSVGRLVRVRADQLEERFEDYYPQFRSAVEKIQSDSITTAVEALPFHEVYPQKATSIDKGKLFVGAAMAALPNEEDYAVHQASVASVAETAQICCPSVLQTYWAGQAISETSQFDGEQVALLRDLTELKSSEVCVFILLENLPSSVLVEIGYAIALNKRIIVFCTNRGNLPFLLRRADEQIVSLSVIECDGFDHIESIFDKDGEALVCNHIV